MVEIHASRRSQGSKETNDDLEAINGSEPMINLITSGQYENMAIDYNRSSKNQQSSHRIGSKVNAIPIVNKKLNLGKNKGFNIHMRANSLNPTAKANARKTVIHRGTTHSVGHNLTETESSEPNVLNSRQLYAYNNMNLTQHNFNHPHFGGHTVDRRPTTTAVNTRQRLDGGIGRGSYSSGFGGKDIDHIRVNSHANMAKVRVPQMLIQSSISQGQQYYKTNITDQGADKDSNMVDRSYSMKTSNLNQQQISHISLSGKLASNKQSEENNIARKNQAILLSKQAAAKSQTNA